MGSRASAARLSPDLFATDALSGIPVDVLKDRLRGSLVGLFIGDALAMPAHWYYSTEQLRQDHGTITGYVPAKERMQGSIMNLSNTGGGGRGSDRGDVIGRVINHGKAKYWKRGGNYFYHRGLAAGENTLEANVALVLLRSIRDRGAHDVPAFRDAYVSFMTTPGSHNDTYASTYARQFFANLDRGLPPHKCPDNDGHNTDAIDTLTTVAPVVVATLGSGGEALRDAVVAQMGSLRKSAACEQYGAWFAALLLDTLRSGDARVSATRAAARVGVDLPAYVSAQRGADPMTACYLDSAVPAMLHFAYKYPDPAAGLLASVNAGGENVARGAALGALYGAAVGFSAFPQWMVDGLAARDDILEVVDAVVEQTVAQLRGAGEGEQCAAK